MLQWRSAPAQANIPLSLNRKHLMPTYEYRCSQGHHFELFQRMSEPPADRCPQCGAAAERLLSAGGGLIFKGSGFYITDYRSDTYKKAAEKEGGAAQPAAEGGTASPPPSSESKPAAGGSSTKD
jgi:putative FmdB family regulatory protein